MDPPMTEATYRLLKKQLREQQSVIPLLLDEVTAVRRALEQRGRTVEPRVLNVLEFALLFQFETACLVEDMADHDPSRRGQLYARLLILTIYENTSQLRNLLSRQFKEDLRTTGFDDNEIETVRRVHRDFISIYENCNRRWGKVRHGAVAHRDPSAEVQLRLIDKADIHNVTDLAIQFQKASAELSRVLRWWVNKLRPLSQ